MSVCLCECRCAVCVFAYLSVVARACVCVDAECNAGILGNLTASGTSSQPWVGPAQARATGLPGVSDAPLCPGGHHTAGTRCFRGLSSLPPCPLPSSQGPLAPSPPPGVRCGNRGPGGEGTHLQGVVQGCGLGQAWSPTEAGRRRREKQPQGPMAVRPLGWTLPHRCSAGWLASGTCGWPCQAGWPEWALRGLDGPPEHARFSVSQNWSPCTRASHVRHTGPTRPVL